ncbi:hypothetical protein [Actinopolymorpha pittospori]
MQAALTVGAERASDKRSPHFRDIAVDQTIPLVDNRVAESCDVA